MSNSRKEVDGKDKSLKDLLSNARYEIDYYQREYRWGTKQVHELIDDLTSRFLSSYEGGHARPEIRGYPAYFLGSIILSRKDQQIYIIDGQQRLTTITLLLIYLRNLQIENSMALDPNVESLILSTQFGVKNLNIAVDERREMMEALFEGRTPPSAEDDSTLGVLRARYEDIGDYFPAECRGEVLPFFMDWLTERVKIVEISAYSDEDAYTIFETMNDRGLSLSPADMLKGLVLSNIRDALARNKANENWKRSVVSLSDLGRDGENDFFRVWFRGRLGETVGAASDDFERLGPEFHRWLRDNASSVGLNHSDDFDRFANRELPFFASQYRRIHSAQSGSDELLRTIHLNLYGAATVDARFAIMAPLMPSDSAAETTAKLRLVADYLDIFIMRRVWASRNTNIQALKGTLVPLARTVRSLTADALAAHLLLDLLKPGPDDFDVAPPSYSSATRTKVHRLLARLSDYVESEAGLSNERFARFMVTSGRAKFSIEHLLPSTYDWSNGGFDSESEFLEWRNKLGALVLLPHTFNASYQDMDWEEKFPLYSRPEHNLLAASLAKDSYANNPRLREFMELTGTPFRPYVGGTDRFDKRAIEERTELYRSIARQVWNPVRLLDPNVVDVDRVRELVLQQGTDIGLADHPIFVDRDGE